MLFHTNLDNVLINGVNLKIAQKLGLENVEILSKKENGGDQEIGSGLRRNSWQILYQKMTF